MSQLRQALALILIWTQIVLLLSPTAHAQAEDTTSPGPSADELHQLVAPIALYPDSLIGQILAASQYPTQIVEAQRWLQTNSTLSATQLAQGANSQSWDPSVKSLTAFPDVLNNMDTNLSWTSSLGEAYYSDPQGVLQAVQTMRAQAQAAGTLKSNSKQTVETQGQTIVIVPADPQVVYVPQYNPTVVYGAPVAAYPGYSGADLALTGVLAFGAGVAVGALVSSSDGWGYHNWNTNWHGGNVTYNKNVYVSNTNNYHAWSNNSSNWNKNNTWNKNTNSWNSENKSWNKNNNNWNNANRNNGPNRNQPNNSWNKNAGNVNRADNSNWNKNNNNRNNANRDNGPNRNQPNSSSNKSAGNVNRADRGFGYSGGGAHPNAFGGSRPGGDAWADSGRGRSSSGGGGFGGNGGRSGSGSFQGGGRRGGGRR